jgi:hypothetical protein
LDWLRDNEALAWWLGSLSLVLLVGGAVAAPIVIVRIPADYFVRRELSRSGGPWLERYPILRVTLRVLKNLLGAVLVLLGGLMTLPLAPGPGVLAMVVGLALLDIPGKRGLQLRLLRNRAVIRPINALRARAGRPPLVLPPRPKAGERRDEPGGGDIRAV